MTPITLLQHQHLCVSSITDALDWGSFRINWHERGLLSHRRGAAGVTQLKPNSGNGHTQLAKSIATHPSGEMSSRLQYPLSIMSTKMNRTYVYGSIARPSETQGGLGGTRLNQMIERVVSRSNERLYQKGDIVYQPGDVDDSVYYIKSGKIKLAYLDESGRKLTLTILGEGELFGEMVLIGRQKRELMAQVLQDSVLYELERTQFLELLRSSPELAIEVMELFGNRTRDIERKLEDLVFKDIPTRLSRQILKLIEQHGVDTDDGVQIDFKITHKELADLIGSARENTTSALNRLAKEGILDKKRYHIVVKDEERLKEKSGT